MTKIKWRIKVKYFLNVCFASVILFLLCACSGEFLFSPELKGIAVWDSKKAASKRFDSGESPERNNLSGFISIYSGEVDWEPYQAMWSTSIYTAADLAKRFFKNAGGTVFCEEDFTDVQWTSLDEPQVKGYFEFDAFYGNGRVVFKAAKINGEWVIPYMAIPQKDKADNDDPYVIFDLSEDEVAKLMQ